MIAGPEPEAGRTAARSCPYGREGLITAVPPQGADLDGVVSFHGSLPPATEAQQGKIRAKVLVAHGAADGFVLDREGFVLRNVPTAVADLHDDAAVEGQYYDEIEALLTES